MPDNAPKDRTMIIDRACPLEENKHILDQYERVHNEKRNLDLMLVNRDRLETCPVASLDPWSIEMWNEYNLRKAFGDMQNLPEIMFKAFTVILIEQNTCDHWADKDRERERNNDAAKAKRGLR